MPMCYNVVVTLQETLQSSIKFGLSVLVCLNKASIDEGTLFKQVHRSLCVFGSLKPQQENLLFSLYYNKTQRRARSGQE